MAEQATLEVQVCIGESVPTLDLQTIVATNIPPEIFVYRQSLERDDMGCYIIEFCNVASCFQMTDLPAPDPIAGVPFFRRDNVSLTFDNFKELQDALALIQTDIDCLLKEWNNKLVFDENKFILTFPTGTC